MKETAVIPVCVCVCIQGQACVLVLRAMQSREVQQLLDGAPWTDLCAKVTAQLAAVSSAWLHVHPSTSFVTLVRPLSAVSEHGD